MIRNLLLSGGPGHDFAATNGAVALLLDRQGVHTTVVEEPADLVAHLRDADAGRLPPFALLTVNALHWGMDTPRYAHLRPTQARHLDDADARVIESFVRRGGGLLALHTAVICFDAQPRWRALLGASWDWEASSHPPWGAVAARVTPAGRAHPLTAGLGDFVIDDEAYGFLDEMDGLAPLLTAAHGGRDQPLLWAREVGHGRVVTDLLGHGAASTQHPAHRTILTRAAAWACRAPVPS